MYISVMSGPSHPLEAKEDDFQQVESTSPLLDSKTTITEEGSSKGVDVKDRVQELRGLADELIAEAIQWAREVKEEQDAFESLSIADRCKKKTIEQGKKDQEEWNAHMDGLIAILHKHQREQPKQLEKQGKKDIEDITSMEQLYTKILHSDEVQLAIAKQYAEKFELLVSSKDYTPTFIDAAINYVTNNLEWLKKYQDGSTKKVGIISNARYYAEKALEYYGQQGAQREVHRAAYLIALLNRL